MTDLTRLLTSVAQLESQVPTLSDGEKAQSGRKKAEGNMARALTNLGSTVSDLDDELATEEVDLTEDIVGTEGSNPTEVLVTPTFKRIKMDEEEPANPPPPPRAPEGNQTAALVSYLKDKAKVNLLTHFMNALINCLI